MDSKGTLGHRALTGDLYDGTSGIALFLFRLANASGERIFRATAEAALRQAISKRPIRGPGLYAGGLGVFYGELEMHGEVDWKELSRQSEPDPAELDLISGSAGAIAVLLFAYARSSEQRLLDRAIEHGDLLLAQAHRSDEGSSWNTVRAKRHLTGFSHGVAGISWALLELYRATGEPRFLVTALDGFRYERAQFDATRGNWPDYRDDRIQFLNAWCHGAAGVGLSRLRAWQLLGESEMRSEASVALATTGQHVHSMGNFSLCHGASGNADVLISASRVFDDAALLAPVLSLASEALDRFERRRVPWPCGLAGTNELPDLMLGLAGIGHFYLRLADPALPTPLLIV
ncbi:MAG: hypothetical protein JO033_06460 [Acidobacteriaceae bacterium]|nr:hypothetical protein [Acidobacteriaceae bacterium]